MSKWELWVHRIVIIAVAIYEAVNAIIRGWS
ncbi:hypothetical protein ES703_43439 [subsurface metagenome]